MMAGEGSNMTYNHIGVSDAFHPLSHHQNDKARKERLVRIQTYHSQAFAKFLTKLAAMPDGDGSMLDHSILLYGSNMSNSNAHDEFPLPTLVVGGGCGKLKGGQHLQYPGPDAAGEPAADAARPRRRAGGEGRQQHRRVLGAVDCDTRVTNREADVASCAGSLRRHAATADSLCSLARGRRRSSTPSSPATGRRRSR